MAKKISKAPGKLSSAVLKRMYLAAVKAESSQELAMLRKEQAKHQARADAIAKKIAQLSDITSIMENAPAPQQPKQAVVVTESRPLRGLPAKVVAFLQKKGQAAGAGEIAAALKVPAKRMKRVYITLSNLAKRALVKRAGRGNYTAA